MNQQVTTTNSQPTELAPLTIDTLSSYLEAMGLANKLSKNEQAQFLQIAQAYGLNPFKREIYCTKYGEGQYAQFSIIVGYETYIKRAERSGKLNGWQAEFHGEGDSLSCVVTIWRKDWERPFKHEAWYEESVQRTKDGRPTKFWEKRRLMTRKVAISQAFRMAFSDELGGMPYTDDELGVNIQDVQHEVVAEGKGTQAVNRIMEQAGAPLEAHPTQSQQAPAPKKPSKLELAEAARQLDEWNKRLGEIQQDVDRVGNPTAYDVAAAALGAIANIERKEKIQIFKGLVALAYENGVDYDPDSKKFYLAEPNQPTDEEMSEALAENG
ncbi:phage recombination protein Bet [Spirosoma fluminis]